MFQVKIVSELKLAADNVYPNLYNTDFQKIWRCCFAKNTGVEALKMHYQYAVIGFVCGSSTNTWSPEKYVTNIWTSNLFVV